jgi:hypothetical protein
MPTSPLISNQIREPQAASEPGDPPSASTPSARERPWPDGPLDAAQRAFDLLTCPPAPLAFDCRGIDGLPDQLVALDELRRLLIRNTTPRATQDQAWRELVARARRDGPAWVVAAVGMAVPGLRRRAILLTRGRRADFADLDGELLLGFLERLKTIDLDAGNICPRLIDAGARRVKKSRGHSEDTESIHTADSRSLPPVRPWDHPDFVLTRAVAAAVIAPEECYLIGETRLGEMTLHAVAQRLGVATTTAASWRRKAEEAIREAIRDGELRWVHLDSTG